MPICPTCGRDIQPRKPGSQKLAAHYNPNNPPVYGAWINCPGPTQRDLAFAETIRAQNTQAGYR